MVAVPIAAALLSLAGDTPVPPSVSAAESLRAGNFRFMSGQSTHGRQSPDRRTEVAKGQSPFAMVLTCADSRVSPEIVFDQGLGDLFVVRVAGNIADNNGMASLEYATEHLGSHVLVVLGHERCGAVKAALDTFTTAPKKADHGHGHGSTDHAHGFIPGLLHEIKPAVDKSRGQGGDPLDNAIKANVLLTVAKITKQAPFDKWVASGRLTVIGAVYDLDSGRVKFVSQTQPKPGSAHVEVHRD